MKNIGIYLFSVFAGVTMLASCSDFEELNVNPKAASPAQIQAEYFLNKSITDAQQDPNIAERIFVLYWTSTGRQNWSSFGGLPTGSSNDDWSSQYYANYLSAWLMSANSAIQIADQQIASGVALPHVNNLKQCARIWRAYLLSEVTDNFGPCSLDGFQGKTPTFSTEKACYEFMLSELKDATSKMDINVLFSGNVDTDHVYGYNFSKWQKYGNSLRMRFAMRVSNTDLAGLAKTEFEDASKKPYIASVEDMFQVKEQPGWDALTGVMSREWNDFFLSATINNLMVGLGGVTTQESIGGKYDLPVGCIKPDNWYGVKYTSHFVTLTNDPCAGFYFDGLHNVIDPRAYEMFQIPGNNNTKTGKYDAGYCFYPSWTKDQTTQTFKLLPYVAKDGHDASINPVSDTIKLDASYKWNALTLGSSGIKGSSNEMYTTCTGLLPGLRKKFRDSSNKRVFFGAWESYFLIAEAAVKSWSVPMSGQAAYEKGITESFAYNGQSDLVAKYLTSTSYNRVGTSVSWSHVAEAPSQVFDCKDGYTGAAGTVTWTKPTNTIYGANNNDLLNKIITQKFIAQTPWLPLETWSDHRRLGLPFFENPAVENLLTKLPDLTKANVLTGNSIKYFPQRLKYPSSLSISSPVGYTQAVGFLSNGKDEVLTPLWWAKKQ